MTGEETSKKEDKAKSDKSGTGPTGCEELDMMKTCYTGEGAFSDCAAMMASRMGAMTKMPCCRSGIKTTEHDGREK